MKFGKNRSTEEVIADLSHANPKDIPSARMLFCFLKVIAAALKLDFDDTRQSLNEIAERTPSEIIGLVNTCLDQLRLGHQLSRGHPDEKHKGLRSFALAMDALQAISSAKDFPDWLLIPLMTDVKARQASLYFYVDDYGEADKRFTEASQELSAVMSSPEWPFIGLYDKEISLKGFHLSTFLVHARERELGADGIVEILGQTFDEPTTGAVESALWVGDAHNKGYIAPLSDWIRDSIRKAKLTAAGIPYDVGAELFNCDKYEYFSACGKYMSNRAWIDLYLFSQTADESFRRDGLRRFDTSMNAMVEAGANRDYPHYYANRQAAEGYCLDAEQPIAEVQNSLARNLFYRMLFSILAAEPESRERDMAWLEKLYDKELPGDADASSVINSLAAGYQNACRIGLPTESLELVRQMPARMSAALLPRISTS